MIELVGLDEVKAHCRIDGDESDDDLVGKIRAASAAIIRYCQGSRDDIVDKNGELIDGEALCLAQEATLRLVGRLYRDPDGRDTADLSRGELPNDVTMLIYDLRRPTII
ncbi:head-tail connector protein [Hafnia alvei]|uniref:head-tail connector protein n=1 Tax=Hafnia alvei TaxID=569 RepID=UPI00243334DB|nr:head-tail connector protein [Hafnia alvei]